MSQLSNWNRSQKQPLSPIDYHVIKHLEGNTLDSGELTKRINAANGSELQRNTVLCSLHKLRKHGMAQKVGLKEWELVAK